MPSDCQPCQGIEPRTPESVANRPGLPALRYRAGRHGTFLESMIARLSAVYAKRQSDLADAHPDPRTRPEAPPWLHTREPGDPSIALLDAWATIGDVLTFYQERIANEGYLKTARERRSLHELANQVGYQLRPAMSASAYLAFDVQAPPSLDPEVKVPPPHEIRIPKGTQAKSIPEPGQLPAVFETGEDLIARPEWNALRPRTATSTIIDIGGENSVGNAHEITRLRFHRMDHNLRPGDFLLLEGRSSDGGRPSAFTRQIRSVTLDADRSQTVVDLANSVYSYIEYQQRIADASLRFRKAVSSIKLISPELQGRAKEWSTESESIPGTVLRQKMHEADSTVWTGAKSLEKISRRWQSPESDVSNRAPLNQYREAIRAFEEGVTGTNADSLQSLASRIPKALASQNVLKVMNDALTDALLLTKHLELLAKNDDDMLKDDLTPQQMIALANSLQDEVKTVSTSAAKVLLKEFDDQLRKAASEPTKPGRVTAVEKSLEIIAGGKQAHFVDDAITELTPEAGSIFRISQRKELLKFVPWSADQTSELRDVEDASEIVDRDFVNTLYWSQGTRSPLLDMLCTSISTAWRAERDARVNAIQLAVSEIRSSISKYLIIPKEEIDVLMRDLEEQSQDLKIVVTRTINAIGVVKNKSAEIYRIKKDVETIASAAEALLRDWRETSKAIVEMVNVELADLLGKFPSANSLSHTDVQNRIEAIGKIDGALAEEATEASDGRLKFALRYLQPTSNAAIGAADRITIDNRVNRIANALRANSTAGESRRQTIVGTIGSDDDLSSLINFSGSHPTATTPGNALQGNSGLLGGLIGRLGGQDERNRFNAWGRRKVDVPLGKVYAFRSRASLFGASLSQGSTIEGTEKHEDETTTITTKMSDPISNPETDEGATILFLDHEYPDIVAGGWCLVGSIGDAKNKTATTGILGESSAGRSVPLPIPFFIMDAVVMQRRAYLASSKTVRLSVSEKWQVEPKGDDVGNFRNRIRSTIVFVSSTELPLADEIIETPFPGPDTKGEMTRELSEDKTRYRPAESIDLADFHGDLLAGRDLILVGEQVVPREGIPEGVLTNVNLIRGCRVATARSEPDAGGTRVLTTLTVTPPLDVRFKRDSVRIYANVVRATHGEIQHEVLGSGEGQGEFQQFALSQRQLTYLPEATPTGMAPQVSVRVNNVAWARAEKVGDMRPAVGEGMPREYLVAVDDDERAILTTGDGKTTGERLPTGVANVTVEYRVGGGTGGNVKDGDDHAAPLASAQCDQGPQPAPRLRRRRSRERRSGPAKHSRGGNGPRPAALDAGLRVIRPQVRRDRQGGGDSAHARRYPVRRRHDRRTRRRSHRARLAALYESREGPAAALRSGTRRRPGCARADAADPEGEGEDFSGPPLGAGP